jgi:hypothetical protein
MAVVLVLVSVPTLATVFMLVLTLGSGVGGRGSNVKPTSADEGPG